MGRLVLWLTDDWPPYWWTNWWTDWLQTTRSPATSGVGWTSDVAAVPWCAGTPSPTAWGTASSSETRAREPSKTTSFLVRISHILGSKKQHHLWLEHNVFSGEKDHHFWAHIVLCKQNVIFGRNTCFLVKNKTKHYFWSNCLIFSGEKNIISSQKIT